MEDKNDRSFEHFKQEFRSWFPNWSDDQVNEYARLWTEKYSTIKEGDNVIHLEYYHGLLNDSDLHEISQTLKIVDFELSRFDRNGVPMASLDDFMLQLFLMINDSIVKDILIGSAGSMLWDSIKSTSIYIWKKIKLRYWEQKEETDKPLNFGLKMKLDENTKFDFNLSGNLSEEILEQSVDKILEILKASEKNKHPKSAGFYRVDENGEWEKVNVNEEILKLHSKKKKKKK